MFSLTRVVGDRLTCSCAFPQAFHPYDVARNEFCQMLPQKSSSEITNYYDINCVSDLDEDGGPIDVCKCLIYISRDHAINMRRPHIYNILLPCVFLREIITTRVRLLVPLGASIRNYWMVCI